MGKVMSLCLREYHCGAGGSAGEACCGAEHLRSKPTPHGGRRQWPPQELSSDFHKHRQKQGSKCN